MFPHNRSNILKVKRLNVQLSNREIKVFIVVLALQRGGPRVLRVIDAHNGAVRYQMMAY